jgi:hypothetical protein
VLGEDATYIQPPSVELSSYLMGGTTVIQGFGNKGKRGKGKLKGSPQTWLNSSNRSVIGRTGPPDTGGLGQVQHLPLLIHKTYPLSLYSTFYSMSSATVSSGSGSSVAPMAGHYAYRDRL